MRFLSIFTAAALTASFTSALPTTEATIADVADVAERAADSSTYYTVSDLFIESSPGYEDVSYFFFVKGHSEGHPFRRFGLSRCELDLKATQLQPVPGAICQSDALIYFSMHKYLDDNGDFAGWTLGISHPYHNNVGLNSDYAEHKFPKSLIKVKGQGKNKRHVIGGPRKFNMTVSE